MNTGEADMDVIGERTEYVFGRSVEAGGSGAPPCPPRSASSTGSAPASGTSSGRTTSLGGTVLVQGAGGVGSALAERLAKGGASVFVADIDPARAEAVAGIVDGATVAADRVFEHECDVFAPCATGVS